MKPSTHITCGVGGFCYGTGERCPEIDNGKAFLLIFAYLLGMISKEKKKVSNVNEETVSNIIRLFDAQWLWQSGNS